MDRVLKKLKVRTLYVHIVAQFNHRGLGVKVKTNCLRESDLIPSHSFLSTTVSIFIKAAFPRAKFLCHISHALQSLLTDFCGIITVNFYSRTGSDEK